MSYVVYAIRSEFSGKIYIGQTVNLEKRLARHNDQLPYKASSFTKTNCGPWKLWYREDCCDRAAAMKREKN